MSEKKQFRLTLPKKEGEALIEQAKAEGYKTPQQLILDRIRCWEALQKKHAAASRREIKLIEERDTLEQQLLQTRDKDAQIRRIAETQTHEVLSFIKESRSELLMLYAFQYIFPKVPKDVAEVIEANNLIPGIFYMKHVCLTFPQYLKQIKILTNIITQAALDKKELKTENADLKQQLKDAATLPAALTVVLRDDASLEELCKRLHIRLLGNPTDLEAARKPYMEEKGGSLRHQDYVSRALRSYQVYKKEDFEAQEKLRLKQSVEIADLQRSRNFYKNKSWFRKLWESLGGRKTLPLPAKSNTL